MRRVMVLSFLLVCVLGGSLSAKTFGPPNLYTTPGHHPSSIAAGDFNSDGRTDVASTTRFCPLQSCALLVFLQTADGRLDVPVVYPGSPEMTALVAGHFNDDSRVDLAYISYSVVFVLLQRQDGTFAGAATYDTPKANYDLETADVNKDGRMDLVTVPWGGEELAVFLQRSQGGFERKMFPMSGAGYDELELADLNGDGQIDAINIAGQGSLGLSYVNFGIAGSLFAKPVNVRLPWNAIFDSFGTMDLNGDGRLDLAVVSSGAYGKPSGPFLGIAVQRPDGSFEAGPILPEWPWPTAILVRDVDGDNDSDIIVGGGKGISVWLQARPSVFIREELPLPTFSNFSIHDEIAVEDVNHDGILDLLIAADSGSLVVYEGTPSVRRRAARH